MAFGTNTTITNGGKAASVFGLLGQVDDPKFLALGTGATGAARTAAVGDTGLSNEIAIVGTNAGAPTTVNVSDDTYTVAQTYTAVADVAIDEAGLFDAASGGNMFLSATFPVVNLLNGDTIQVTAEVTYS
tara:strand:+ start:17998 stop:18387 length:390 start_codon:yes stop_codon:yes gene_type:complete